MDGGRLPEDGWPGTLGAGSLVDNSPTSLGGLPLLLRGLRSLGGLRCLRGLLGAPGLGAAGLAGRLLGRAGRGPGPEQLDRLLEGRGGGIGVLGKGGLVVPSGTLGAVRAGSRLIVGSVSGWGPRPGWGVGVCRSLSRFCLAK